MSRTDTFKQQAAARALELVESGMIIGLGEGSTAWMFVQMLGERIRGGELDDIVAIAASERMTGEAENQKIPLTCFDERPLIDLTVDGADEVDPGMNLIKGGGGALLREKILAQASRRVVIIADESKLSPTLGTIWALPVEVVTFGWSCQVDFLSALGADVSLRTHDDGEPFQTDHGNLILDCKFGPIRDPHGLDLELRARVGVVEHGLFLGLATDVIVAGPDGIRLLEHGE